MRKIIIWILMVLLIQSCGFQSRKYTTGYYANFSREVETSAHPIVKTALSADKNDSTKFFHSNQSSPIVAPKTFQFEHSPSLKTNCTSVEELQSSELTIQKNNTSPVDTLKIRFGHKTKDKSELQPPKELQPFVMRRRRDTFYTFLSCAIMMIMGFIAYNGPTYWSGAGLSVVSLLTSWLSIKTLNDLLKMRKQMKKIPIDEQKQKWYPRMKIKNIIASIFIPFYLLVLYTAVIFAIFGVLIFFEI